MSGKSSRLAGFVGCTKEYAGTVCVERTIDNSAQQKSLSKKLGQCGLRLIHYLPGHTDSEDGIGAKLARKPC